MSLGLAALVALVVVAGAAGCTSAVPLHGGLGESADVARSPAAPSATEELWSQVTYDPRRPPVEWVDAAAGTFRMSFMGAYYCGESLEDRVLGITGADFITAIVSPDGGCLDAGEMKTYLTALPMDFDRSVPVLVSRDGRVVGELPPADSASPEYGSNGWPWRPTVPGDVNLAWVDRTALTFALRVSPCGALGVIELIDRATVDITTESSSGDCAAVARLDTYLSSLPVGVDASSAITVQLNGDPIGTLPGYLSG